MAKKGARRARHYYKRFKRRASKMTIPLTVVGGIIGMPAFGDVINNLQTNNWGAIPGNFAHMVGINYSTHQWEFQTLLANMTPLAAGIIAHKAASMIGINRALAKAKIPIFRV